MREVRGVRRLAAARMSLAKAKSDCGMGLLNHGCSLRKIRLGRTLGWGRRRFALQERQNLVSRSVGDQAAVVKQQQSVHQAEQRKPVGGDDDGHPIGTDRLQAFQKLGLAADVEVCRRLVEEEDKLGFTEEQLDEMDRQIARMQKLVNAQLEMIAAMKAHGQSLELAERALHNILDILVVHQARRAKIELALPIGTVPRRRPEIR